MIRLSAPDGDGTIVIVQGATDLTGARTSFVQIAADAFSISPNDITITTGDTETAPQADMSAGSRITRTIGSAVLAACEDAKAQLIRFAATWLQVKPEEIEFVNGHARVIKAPDQSASLAELARGAMTSPGVGPIIGRGSVNIPSCPMFVVAMAEVEVDKDTGKVKLTGYASAQDVGFAINPALAGSQIQGAVSQGTGWALMEGYSYRDGVMQNANFLDYRLPTAADLPPIEPILVEVKAQAGAFGMRGVGEPSIVPTLAAIANAIHSAMGVRITQIPMTPEAVFWALSDKKKAEKK